MSFKAKISDHGICESRRIFDTLMIDRSIEIKRVQGPSLKVWEGSRSPHGSVNHQGVQKLRHMELFSPPL